MSRRLSGFTAVLLLGSLLLLAPIHAPVAKAANADLKLEVRPEASSAAVVNQPFRLTAETVDQSGMNPANVTGSPLRVAFEVESGPGNADGNANRANPDFFCTIAVNASSCHTGTAFTGATTGPSIVRAWLDQEETDVDAGEERIARRLPIAYLNYL
jgi:hypothetical protein